LEGELQNSVICGIHLLIFIFFIESQPAVEREEKRYNGKSWWRVERQVHFRKVLMMLVNDEVKLMVIDEQIYEVW
jgi:hypothetical protein